MSDYPIVVYRTERDGLWMAEIPDLPGCTAHGETPEEAVREVRVAKDAWIEVAREIGKPVPEPTGRPVLASAAR